VLLCREKDRQRWHVSEEALKALGVDGEQRLKEVRDAEMKVDQEKEKGRQSKREKKKDDQVVERKKRKLETEETKAKGLASFWGQ
jgi:hypothetical protein